MRTIERHGDESAVAGTYGNLLTLVLDWYDARFDIDFWNGELTTPDINEPQAEDQEIVGIDRRDSNPKRVRVRDSGLELTLKTDTQNILSLTIRNEREMERDDWTRRSTLRYCGLGIAGLGGCVSGQRDSRSTPGNESATTTSGTATKTTESSPATKAEKPAGSSDTHPVLLAISSYASSDQTATITVTNGDSPVLDETVTVPVNDAVTFEDALAVPNEGSVSYEISVSIRDGARTTKAFTIKSSHDIHAISAVIMSADTIRWGTSGH